MARSTTRTSPSASCRSTPTCTSGSSASIAFRSTPTAGKSPRAAVRRASSRSNRRRASCARKPDCMPPGGRSCWRPISRTRSRTNARLPTLPGISPRARPNPNRPRISRSSACRSSRRSGWLPTARSVTRSASCRCRRCSSCTSPASWTCAATEARTASRDGFCPALARPDCGCARSAPHHTGRRARKRTSARLRAPNRVSVK